MTAKPVDIIMVEDNPAHAKLIKRGLASHNAANRITHLKDGEAAVSYLFDLAEKSEQSQSPLPAVILLDLRLPKVDGLEVLQTVKTHPVLRHIPVVVLSTSAAERDLTKAYENHANAYLTKPVDFDRFMRQMDDLGHFWLSWNTPLLNSGPSQLRTTRD